ATPEQRDAVVALLKERATSALGDVLAVRTAPVAFDASGDMYRVRVEGVAFMKIKKETGALCCKQPYQLWGKPFVPVKDAKAGYCVGAGCKETGLLQSWTVTD